MTSPGNVISSQSTTTSPTHLHFSLSRSLSLSLTLFNLLFSFGGVNISDARQTARPLDYKLQIVTVLRFEASKVNSSFHLRQRFPFFFSLKTNTIPKIPSSFLLINENRKQNAKPKTLLSPQSSHLHYTYFCTFSEFIHSQVRFLLILAT